MSLYDFLIGWFLIGLLTTIIAVYIDWYAGSNIPINLLFYIPVFSLLGPIIIILAVLDFINNSEFEIKGRKQR